MTAAELKTLVAAQEVKCGSPAAMALLNELPSLETFPPGSREDAKNRLLFGALKGSPLTVELAEYLTLWAGALGLAEQAVRAVFAPHVRGLLSVGAELRPHRDFPAPHVEWVTIAIERSEPSKLSILYSVIGDVDGLRLPATRFAARVDELWQHTCFEVFIRLPASDTYWEINLAPTSEWAAYAFRSYRERAADPELAPPAIGAGTDARSFALHATLDLSAIPGLDPAAPWTLGLSAVIEDKGGERSYWALAHPPGKPDFHHASAFTLHLPPPDRP